jgi:hypothetical protein
LYQDQYRIIPFIRSKKKGTKFSRSLMVSIKRLSFCVLVIAFSANVERMEEQLDEIGDDAQQSNIDLQNRMQSQQKVLQ